MVRVENKAFKKLFGDVARARGFGYQHSYWSLESDECIFTLDLQKSNYGNYYYLNINTFIQGVQSPNGTLYVKNKTLIRGMGQLIRRPPSEYDIYLDLDASITLEERSKGIEQLFDDFLLAFAKKALTKKGIYELAANREIILMERVKQQLDALTQSS